jgi:peroxiredoxin Q/BCP
MEKFTALGTAVVGCSADSMEALSKFKAKHNLDFSLFSDPEFQIIEAYGARRMKRFLGKSYLGIVRMTFWISPDGRIRRIWDKVSSKGHAADVLAAIQAGKPG